MRDNRSDKRENENENERGRKKGKQIRERFVVTLPVFFGVVSMPMHLSFQYQPLHSASESPSSSLFRFTEMIDCA